MFIRRVIYALALAGSIAFYALYPFWVSQYIMVLVLLLVPFDLIISMPGMLEKRVSLKAPKVLEKGESGTLVVTTLQKHSFPSGRIKARLATIGDDFTSKRKIICDPESGSRYETAIDTSHSGITVFKIRRLHTASILGLFSLMVTVDRRATALILPAPVKPKHIVSLPRGVILRPKPGGGFSEDSDLRPYRKGDPVRSIHWKLSAKHDSLVIREPMIPPNHSRLVKIMKWSGAQERDIILGRLRWISGYLLKWELPYFVKLGDDGQVAEITCEKEFMDYLYSVLGSEEYFSKHGHRSFAKNKRSELSAHLSSPYPIPLPPVPSQSPVSFSWVFHIDAKEGDAE